MESPDQHEINHLLSLRQKPFDFETYPPVYQTQLFAEYVVQRGANSFTPKDIQELFRLAQLKKSLSDEPNQPAPSRIRKYINKAITDRKLALQYDESSDCWLVLHQRFILQLQIVSNATDRLQAKDAVVLSLPFSNRILKHSVSIEKPWLVTLELETKYSSKPAICGEMAELMAMISREWNVKFNNDDWQLESVGELLVRRFVHVKMVLKAINPG